jgi:hypothetical protein
VFDEALAGDFPRPQQVGAVAKKRAPVRVIRVWTKSQLLDFGRRDGRALCCSRAKGAFSAEKVQHALAALGSLRTLLGRLGAGAW